MSKSKSNSETNESLSEEEMDSDSSMDDEEEGVETGNEDVSLGRVYLPGAHMDDDEQLECDQTAYVVYHQASTGAPCLSFDIISEQSSSENEDDGFPLSGYIVGGTQSEKAHLNNLIVVKYANIHPNKRKKQNDDEQEDSSDEDDDEDDIPTMEHAMIAHKGCVNRVKVANVGLRSLVASWSELKTVNIWDLSGPLEALNDPKEMSRYVKNKESPKPLFTFRGHQDEGFAMDWSKTQTGVLATGDNKRNIHIWTPQEGGTWNVDQRPFSAHTASVEDIQWSPNEPNVMSSCSSDASIRIWDTRAAPNKACMLTCANAHESDVNVISWNRNDPFILSGGDDGQIKVWDLRQFQKSSPICVFKHHSGPITSVEWHPTESTIFAASGEDNQLTLWDLSVERDDEDKETNDAALSDLPPQLLFIHQGQKDIKELHWHNRMPGVIISTAHSGINIFKTISV